MRRLYQALIGSAIFATAFFAAAHAPEAKADGFEGGNDFTTVNLSGSLTIMCRDPNTGQTGSDIVSCHQNILTPTDEDYFVTTTNHRAKTVRLTSFHEDGSSASQTVRYHASKQRSKEPVSLWGLIDRLIEPGINTIITTFFDPQDQPLGSGNQFSANISDGGSRICTPKTVHSTTLSDCQGGGQRLCSSYFQEENLCSYGPDGLPDVLR